MWFLLRTSKANKKLLLEVSGLLLSCLPCAYSQESKDLQINPARLSCKTHQYAASTISGVSIGLSNNKGVCMMTVTPSDVLGKTYRSYTFKDNGMVVASTYPCKSNSAAIKPGCMGKRSYVFLPTRKDVTFEGLSERGDLQILDAANNRVTISPKDLRITSMIPAVYDLNPAIDHSNRGGLEILGSDLPYLDLGYSIYQVANGKLGFGPSDRGITLVDPKRKKCKNISPNLIYDYQHSLKGKDPLLYDNAHLYKNLSSQCPTLDLSAIKRAIDENLQKIPSANIKDSTQFRSPK